MKPKKWSRKKRINSRLANPYLVQLNLPPLNQSYLTLKCEKRLRWLRYFRQGSVNRFLIRLARFNKILYGIDPDDTVSFLKAYILFYEKSVYDKGQAYTVKFLKNLYSQCLRFCANHKFDKFEYTTINKSGLPILVDPLLKYMKGEIKERQGSLGLLQLYKLAMVEGDPPPIESIIKENSDSLPTEKIGDYLRRASINRGFSKSFTNKLVGCFRQTVFAMFPKKHLNTRIHKVKSESDVYISSRRGPNGVSIISAPIDWIAIKDTPIMKNIFKWSWLTKDKSLRRLLYLFKCGRNEIKEKLREPNTSRLSIKIESGGKTRLFAIGDWFTQATLTGFHRYLFNTLKGIWGDGTFGHTELAQKIGQWTKDESSIQQGIYSVDLTTATDRLPSYFQREIVEAIIGKDLSTIWYNLMVDRDFSSPYNSDVRYAVGQPMGFYSSWAMLAITHHVVLRTILRMLGKRQDKDKICYGIIGDDVAMLGEDVSDLYHIIMEEILQVPISRTKGYSKETLSNANPLPHNTKSNVAEIAKRVFLDGAEITPISPETAKAGLEYESDFPSLLDELVARGTIVTSDVTTPIALSKLCFEAKRSLELATFPILPAIVYNNVQQVREEAKNHDELRELIWFKDDRYTDQVLELMFSQQLRGELIPQIRSSVDDILKYNTHQTKDFQNKSYLYDSTSFKYLIRLINKSLTNKLKLVETVKLFERGDTKSVDLRDLLSNLHVAFDVTLAFNDQRSLNSMDKKKKTNRLISKLVRGIVKTTTPPTINQSSLSPEIAELISKSVLLSPPRSESDGEFVVTRVTPEILEIDWSRYM